MCSSEGLREQSAGTASWQRCRFFIDDSPSEPENQRLCDVRVTRDGARGSWQNSLVTGELRDVALSVWFMIRPAKSSCSRPNALSPVAIALFLLFFFF